jgi:hypothetical protein
MVKDFKLALVVVLCLHFLLFVSEYFLNYLKIMLDNIIGI